MTYRDIAKRMGLSVMTIRKIERNALRKLSRNPAVCTLLADYIDTPKQRTIWDAIRDMASFD